MASSRSLTISKHQSSPSNFSSAAGDRRQWQRIFETLVEMLQSQQCQIETLAADRDFLHKYIRIQHDGWTSRVALLESHISQTKEEEVKARRVDAAKLDLMVGLKEREAFCYKKQSELAESDLEDFLVCMETLSAEISELKGALNGRVGNSKTEGNHKKDEQCITTLEGEIRNLKNTYKKLSSKKEAEVSALLAEKDFVWNQFKKMESDYIGILKGKKIEVEHANEAVEKLQLNLENLQTLVKEKDEIIAKLEADVAGLEKDKGRHSPQAKQTVEKLQLNIEELHLLAKTKDETIAKLRNDLARLEMNMDKHTSVKSRFSKEDSTKNSTSASVTRAASCPRNGSRNHVQESAKDDGSRKRRYRSSVRFHGLERCSSRQRSRTMSPLGRPMLFHANFKVPKLKDSPVAVH